MSYREFKFLPIDSTQPGFYHPAVADLIREGKPPAIAKKYAHVRRTVLEGLRNKVQEKN